MKYIKYTAAVIALLLMASGCGKKYPDYAQFMNDIILSQELFLEGIESASAPGDVVKVVNEFGDRLVALDERGKKLKEKYPESSGWDAAPPDDLRDDWEKFHSRWSEFEGKWNAGMSGDGKFQKWLHDPQVKAAFRDLNAKMERLSFL